MSEERYPAEKQTSSFKLAKMSKGYNWEVKIYDDDVEVLKARVKELDEWAQDNYGVGE